MEQNNTLPIFKKDPYGNWKQTNPQDFDYSSGLSVSRTTLPMCHLRHSWLEQHIDTISGLTVLDFGSGDNVWVDYLNSLPQNISASGFDIKHGSPQTMLQQPYDLVTAFDVIEHLKDLDEILALDFKFLYLTFPETPAVDSWKDLKSWRHYKPHEHIYMLNLESMMSWSYKNNLWTVASGHPEDVIRKNPDVVYNTSSLILYRLNKLP